MQARDPDRHTYPWFRVYTEIVDDEKIRLLAFEDRWHYIALLACKGKGILDEPNQELARRKVAVKLGLDAMTLDEVARRLAEVELIDARTLQPLAWDRRQFLSDQDPTRNDRKRRYREKQKDSGGNGSGTVQERMRNGSGTHEERLPESESESESDTEKEPISKSVVSPAHKTKKATTDEPLFFELTPERMAWAQAQGFSDASWVQAQTARFISVNDGKRIRSPEKAWQGWLKKGRELGIEDAPVFHGRPPKYDDFPLTGRVHV